MSFHLKEKPQKSPIVKGADLSLNAPYEIKYVVFLHIFRCCLRIQITTMFQTLRLALSKKPKPNQRKNKTTNIGKTPKDSRDLPTGCQHPVNCHC